MKIAVDAMGGDYAPEEIIKGVLEALQDIEEDNIVLIGDEKEINKFLNGRGYGSSDRIEIFHSPERVYMDESPTKAILKKKNSSIRLAFELLKQKKVDAVVSAGNSGAFVASAIFNLGLIDGIEKPAIASILPGKKGKFILIDSGANVDCKVQHLYQFALMGSALATSFLNIERPRVGLLSIGEEEKKGNRLVRQAYDLFKNSSINFVGNVEGTSIFENVSDVVVCDGFVGNVALKIAEGTAQYIKDWILKKSNPMLVDSVGNRLDYEEYGGGILLGIDGLGIICHGRSSSKAIKNAIIITSIFFRNNILHKFLVELRKMGDRYGR